ncbi:40-residue YVTN family beta-propeller repeat-containing protein [Pseudomonas marincola]|nr:cytochrome D1 domain-containing protein [Pseudomonas marincola]SFU04185.1 40-residue YVTN family beta-propeller repeat-containing protein [Pseudomonas marincola]
MDNIRKASCMLLVVFAIAGGAAYISEARAASQADAAPKDDLKAPAAEANRIERDGVVVTFNLQPVSPGMGLIEGALADVQFRISDVASGQPLSAIAPGAWLDQGQAGISAEGQKMQCKSRIGLYLKGVLNAKPLMDLNSYYLMVLNKDASITVIDPNTSLGGITSTMAVIMLKKPAMDWAVSSDDKRLFVSMPSAGEVAIVDTEKFQVEASVPAGVEPFRVALQPDERYLWVGNNSADEASSGVTVIDMQTRKIALSLATGKGHHEIAFSEDSRHAFVSNRQSGTVSVIDIASLKLLATLETGPAPLALSYSPLSQAVYVTDGKQGEITVIDAKSLKVRTVIEVGQGIGPLQFSQEGRYGFVLNTMQDRAVVIDAASDKVMHSLEVVAEPYQLVFTKAYAYIRGLATSRVSMVNLSSLGEGQKPILQSFEAGPSAPKLAGDLPLAESMGQGQDDNAVFVVNPIDNTTYFYMEGMNAPMFGYLNRGHSARAVTVVDRSLREVEPGLYSTRIKLPASGPLDIALMINQPELTHCFTTDVQPNPQLQQAYAKARIEYLKQSPVITLGDPAVARFRVTQGRDNSPRTGVTDLRVRYFMAPSSQSHEVVATELGDGVYEAPLAISKAGVYFVHVGSDSLHLPFGAQAYSSLRVQAVKPQSTASN